MALEKCPFCGTEISDKAATCVHCGWERPPKEEAPEPRVCPDCGNVIEDNEAKACPKCGCPVETPEEEGFPTKVEVTAVKMKKKTRNMLVGALAAIVMVACLIGGGIYVSGQQANERAKAEYNVYIDNLTMAREAMLDGADTAETTCRTVVDIWYSAIYKSKKSQWDSSIQSYYATDFNDAISNYYSSTRGSSAKSYIKDNQNQVNEIMKSLNNTPTGLENAYQAVSDLYDSYSKLTELALSPTGNYNAFGSSYNSANNDFSTNYDKLGTIIPEKK